MDSVAHGLTGVVLGCAGFQRRAGRMALWTSLAASQFPDSDILLLTFNPESYLRWHRGPTHSLVLLPVWAAFIAWIFWEFAGRQNFRWLWLTAAASLLLHLGMDWITSYGTMWLWPITDTRFALSWVFILDPYVWATLGLAWWAFAKTRQPLVARYGLAMVGLYVGLCGVDHALVLRAARREPGTVRAAVYAVPLQPLDWVVVRETAAGIHWEHGGQDDVFRSFQDDQLRPQAEATEAVKLFRWFAEFPVVEKREDHGYTVLRYRDLRFRSPMPWGAVREGTFVVAKAVFDAHDRLLAAQLSGEDRRE